MTVRCFLRGILLSSLLLLVTACGVPSKRVYPFLDLIKPKIDARVVWIANAGSIGETQHKQLPTVIVGDQLYLATFSGELASLTLADGKMTWHVDLKEYLTAGPTVAGDIMYLATNAAEVIAVQIPSAEILWRVPVTSEVLAPPVVAAEKLIIQTVDERIIALQRSDGKQIWVESREIPALTLRGTSTPVVVDDMVYSGFADGTLAALNLNNGKVVWETSIAAARGRTDLERVVDVDGLIFQGKDVLYACAYQGRVAAISRDNGQVIWMRDMSSYTGVVADDNQLYLSDADGKLWALDMRTGATLWRQDTLAGRDISAPAVLGDTVIVGDGDGYLHWLSISDGELLAQQKLNELYADAFLFWGDETTEGRQPTVSVDPVSHHKRLLLRDDAGALSVFSLLPKS